MKKKKILISAYACEPNKGSEPEVGWQWALTLSKLGNQVYVITRSNNKKNIDKYLNKRFIKNLNFVYYDLPKFILWLIKGNKNSYSYLYFFLWQIGIFFAVRPFIKKINFDYIHHVSFVTYRIPSFLCFYNIPFIFGPISGGDTVPIKLRKNFSLKNKINELFRDFSNFYISYSPLINLVFKKSKLIIVTSKETKKFIPKIYHHKVKKLLAVGIEKNKFIKIKKKKNKYFNIIFVGNLLDIKGPMIAIKSFKIIKKKTKKVLFTIIGNGNLKDELLKFSTENNLNQSIVFKNKVKRQDLFSIYKKSDILLAPYLRDSGGLVILEAMSHGVIPVTLNNGGPGEIVNNNCGIKINIKDKNENLLIKNLSNSVTAIIKSKKKFYLKRKNSFERTSQFSWPNKVKYIYTNLNYR